MACHERNYPVFKYVRLSFVFLLTLSSYSQADNANNAQQTGVQPQDIVIAENPICSKDIKVLCLHENVNKKLSNMDVMKCLQLYQKAQNLGINKECQHLIWNMKKNMTKDDKLFEIASTCGTELSNFADCNSDHLQSGHVISCLIEHINEMTNIQCQQFLTDMEAIIFSDYRLIDRFTDLCHTDIEKLKCGRLSSNKEMLFGQGETIDCLAKASSQLSLECQVQVFHVKELQGSEFRLDRPLYFACRDDREKFCSQIQGGHGRVIKCLMKHKSERTMTTQCRVKLTERQKLIAEDYKVSKKLAHECKSEIHEYGCRKDVGKTKVKLIRLSHMLLCLEGALHDGKQVSSNCQSEMTDHREMLMSDYRLSPDLATNCQKDIEAHCFAKLEVGGKTIDCLMQHGSTNPKNKLSVKCRRSLEDLMKVADAGEDWRVDPVLRSACQPVVATVCKHVAGGDGRVLSCLMDHLDSNHMLDECREKLLQIQYFVARDYKLDSKLYKACRKNAKEFCHAKDHWWSDPRQMDPERGPLILPCLYRYVYHPMENIRLSKECAGEVKRVMRQRAVSVHLHPEIEDVCVNDLAEYCVNEVDQGKELKCLQLKLEDLSEKCHDAVVKFTEDEGEHVELNYELSHACADAFNRYCSDLLSKDVDEGALMQCLIDNKNQKDVQANVKCSTSIEHFQLISLKNYNFNPAFKRHCQKDINKHCPNIQSKTDVIFCLSTIHTSDILTNAKNKLSKQCQAQLTVSLLEQHENIKLDPAIDIACKNDALTLCSDVSPGQGKVIECLKQHVQQLSPACHDKIFQREVEEMADNSVDYILMRSCKQSIKQFCADADVTEVLECLKHHRDNEDMDLRCRKEIVTRMIEQNRDYRLNPSLQKSCIRDIPKFCSKIKGTGPHAEEYEGKVILCLKDQYRKHRLSSECEMEIREIIKDAALDYRQDPILAKACRQEIHEFCSEDKRDSFAPGAVEECLKNKFENEEIHNEDCKKQIARVLHESQSDIQSDPLLYRECAVDVKHYCANIPHGQGKQLSCLLTILESKSANLLPKCRTMLSKRKEMFEMAAVVAPVETFNDMFAQISSSPSRNYFFSVSFAVIGTIFVVGLFFGRVTKRVTALAKNK